MQIDFAQIEFPNSYSDEYVIRKSGITTFTSLPAEEGKRLFKLYQADFDKVAAVVADYPTTYLADELGPRLLREASAERDRKLAAFSINGVTIPMNDRETRSDLTGAVVGLDRCADVEAIEWSLGDGHFVTLPRAAILAMADAAFRFVQACFAAHKDIADEIKAAETIHDLDGFDIASHEAWPA